MNRVIIAICLLTSVANAFVARVPAGSTDQYVPYRAVDATDKETGEPGLTSFAATYAINGGTGTAMTTPTTVEMTGMTEDGLYWLLIDEAAMTTLTAGDDNHTLTINITHASMDPRIITVDVYRPKATEGQTIGVTAGAIDTVVSNNDMLTAGEVVTSWGSEYDANLITLSEIGVKVQEDMDANSILPELVWEDPNAGSGTAPTTEQIRQEIDSNSVELAAIKAYIDTEVAAAVAAATAAQTAAEKIDTNTELRTLLYGSDTPGATAAALATAQADLDNPGQYKADVTDMATLTALAAHDANMDTATGSLATSAALATAQADLDNPSQYKADVTDMATLTALAAHDANMETATSALGSSDFDPNVTPVQVSSTSRSDIADDVVTAINSDTIDGQTKATMDEVYKSLFTGKSSTSVNTSALQRTTIYYAADGTTPVITFVSSTKNGERISTTIH